MEGIQRIREPRLFFFYCDNMYGFSFAGITIMGAAAQSYSTHDGDASKTEATHFPQDLKEQKVKSESALSNALNHFRIRERRLRFCLLSLQQNVWLQLCWHHHHGYSSSERAHNNQDSLVPYTVLEVWDKTTLALCQLSLSCCTPDGDASKNEAIRFLQDSK